MADSVRARVFLSCGQATSAEREAAKELARILREEHGYSVYVATEQVSLEGVKEAIFPQLDDAEYMLFVDFPREKLPDGDFRGSLFSHQELAVAAFLETPYIGFRHKDVRREGLSAFLLSNVEAFENEVELPRLLRQELQRREDWNPSWRKLLHASRPDPAEGDDMFTSLTPEGPEPVRFFHLNVRNLHRDKMAISCTAYVEEIRDSRTGEDISFRPAELKWAGTRLPSVPIAAGRGRDLDACFIRKKEPQTIIFASLSDSSHHMAPIAGRPVDVSYVILSENFPLARCTLRIEPESTPQKARVYEPREADGRGALPNRVASIDTKAQ